METELISAIFKEYGIINVIIMLATTVIVNLIKYPIKRRSDKITEFAKEIGVEFDKKALNTCITYMPFAVAFILITIKELIIARHDFQQFDILGVFVDSLVYGGMSMGVYELISMNLKKLKFRKTNKIIVEEYDTARKFNSGDLPKLSDAIIEQVGDEENNKMDKEKQNEKL